MRSGVPGGPANGPADRNAVFTEGIGDRAAFVQEARCSCTGRTHPSNRASLNDDRVEGRFLTAVPGRSDAGQREVFDFIPKVDRHRVHSSGANSFTEIPAQPFDYGPATEWPFANCAYSRFPFDSSSIIDSWRCDGRRSHPAIREPLFSATGQSTSQS